MGGKRKEALESFNKDDIIKTVGGKKKLAHVSYSCEILAIVGDFRWAHIFSLPGTHFSSVFWCELGFTYLPGTRKARGNS